MTVWLAGMATVAAVLVIGRRAGVRERLAGLGLGLPAELAFGIDPLGPSTWSVLLGAVVVGTAVAAGLVPLGLALAVAVAAVVAVRVRAARAAAVRRDAAAQATVEVAVGLAAELRAGRTAAQALAAVAPWSGPLEGPLSSAAAAVAAGAPAAAGLLAAAAVPGAEPLRQVAAAWRVTEATGGRLAGVLDRLAEALDGELELGQELESALAGPRATVVLLAGLPLLGLALGQSVGAHPLQLLLYRPLGWALLGGAAMLDAAGVFVMVRITRWAIRC
jgi:tight adherence protein B